MLLRSSSTPILNSWLANNAAASASSPEANSMTHIARKRSSCLKMTYNAIRFGWVQFDSDCNVKRGSRLLPTAPKKTREEVASSFLSAEEVGFVAALGGGVGGGGITGNCGGGGGGGGEGGSFQSTEDYYETMILANPGNGLLLANYAVFLKEVKKDFVKAEEYCERAILADSSDAILLSFYADLIWETKKDVVRAEAYFDQAVKVDPNGCYTWAAYAQFLWAVDDDEGNEQEEGEGGSAEVPLRSPHKQQQYYD